MNEIIKNKLWEVLTEFHNEKNVIQNPKLLMATLEAYLLAIYEK